MKKIVNTRAGREITLPTSEEDAAINAAALSDPDAQPLSDAELAHLRASGKGWQTKVNALLRRAVEQGKV